MLLRSPQSYDHHCDVIERSGSLDTTTTYGINYRSPLNGLSFYHVCNMGLPPDIMHDLLEGYVPYEMKLMLTYFIKDARLFTLSHLNARIRSFNYGYMNSSRPTQLTMSRSGELEIKESCKSCSNML